MKTITRVEYMDILEKQCTHLEHKVAIAKEDLFTLECAIEDLGSQDFDNVEVIQEDSKFTFKIVEQKNDN